MKIFSRPSVAILMVCRANICRSPMAEGLLRGELKMRGMDRKVSVDSAGTHASQLGHAADGRAQQVCARERIDLRKSRARQVTEEDFLRFDYILAMDQRNYQWLLDSCPESQRDRISRLGSWAVGGSIGDIADPYFGSLVGFEEVMLKLHMCIDGFLAHFIEELKLIEE
jgi:protein-tyrosine phosphatase